MTDQVSICNQALLLLGERTIQDLEEDTTEASLCSAMYFDARNHCLRDLKPNFAKKRSGTLVNGDTPEFGWAFAARLPEDCLLVVDINRDLLASTLNSVTGGGGPTGRHNTGFKEWRVEGRAILSGRVEMQILYISDKAPEAEMDSSFIKALAAYLAGEFAYPLTNSRVKVEEMMKLYGARADDAQATWGQESATVRTENDQLAIVR